MCATDWRNSKNTAWPRHETRFSFKTKNVIAKNRFFCVICSINRANYVFYTTKNGLFCVIYPRKQSKMCVIYLKNRHFCVIPAKIEHKKVNFFDFFSKNFLKIEKFSIFFKNFWTLEKKNNWINKTNFLNEKNFGWNICVFESSCCFEQTIWLQNQQKNWIKTKKRNLSTHINNSI